MAILKAHKTTQAQAKAFEIAGALISNGLIEIELGADGWDEDFKALIRTIESALITVSDKKTGGNDEPST